MEEIKKTSETKVSTFRFTDDDIKKFKELASELNISQSEMFSGLLNTFEIDNAKQLIPNRAKEIETFQVTAEKLKSMFLSSLEINQTSEERIREELSLELKTKDQTIADLQNFKIDANNQLKTASDQAQLDIERIVSLEKSAKEVEKQLETKVIEAQDHKNQIKTLTDQLNYQSDDLKRFKIENVDLIAENKLLKKAVATDQLVLQELKSTVEKLKNEIVIEIKQKEFYEAEVTTLKNDHKLQLQKLEDNIEKKDETIKTLREDQKYEISMIKTENDEIIKTLREDHSNEISAIKAEIRAEKDEAVEYTINLKTAEFELIKQQLEQNIKQLSDENTKLSDENTKLKEIKQ